MRFGLTSFQLDTCLFDMGNVLLGFDPLALLDLFTTDANQRTRLHTAIFSSHWVELDAGKIDFEDVLKALRSELTPDDYARAERFMNEWHHHLPIQAGMEDVLKSLKYKGRRLILCSNASVQFETYRNAYTILSYFDAYVISGTIQKVKPQLDYFEHVLKTHDLTAKQCFFIDDLWANVVGARQCGIQSHWFTGDVKALRCALEQVQLL
jgi:HAD superfamily hydrolase (TIGR01509 family)